jgi:hypothetical protein
VGAALSIAAIRHALLDLDTRVTISSRKSKRKEQSVIRNTIANGKTVAI